VSQTASTVTVPEYLRQFGQGTTTTSSVIIPQTTATFDLIQGPYPSGIGPELNGITYPDVHSYGYKQFSYTENLETALQACFLYGLDFGESMSKLIGNLCTRNPHHHPFRL
jgi:hypothetical protein